MEIMKACIFNIQKFSIHDGPGIRTVVFFKGCPLQCLWCSNPESQNSTLLITPDKSKCVKFCPNKAFKIEGEYLTINEVMKEVLKDKVFYEESNGGVTLSGGEVLQQHKFSFDLLKLLKEEKIHTAIETTGYTSNKIFSNFIENVDLILFDIKHYDRQKHFEATHVYNDIIIENLKTAISKGNDVIIRIPIIPTINANLDDAKQFCKLFKTIGATKVNLLPFHQFGEKKYDLLNKEYTCKNIPALHEEDILEYQSIFIKNGFDCYF